MFQNNIAMETLLEQQRRYHEERERLVDALVQERLGEKKTHKDAINSEHRQRAMLERWGYCAPYDFVIKENWTNEPLLTISVIGVPVMKHSFGVVASRQMIPGTTSKFHA